MVRVQGNPFQVARGEYHSLLNDGGSSNTNNVRNRSPSPSSSSRQRPAGGGTGGGVGGGQKHSHTSVASQSTRTANYVAVLVVVIFFAVMYNSGNGGMMSDENQQLQPSPSSPVPAPAVPAGFNSHDVPNPAGIPDGDPGIPSFEDQDAGGFEGGAVVDADDDDDEDDSDSDDYDDDDSYEADDDDAAYPKSDDEEYEDDDDSSTEDDLLAGYDDDADSDSGEEPWHDDDGAYEGGGSESTEEEEDDDVSSTEDDDDADSGEEQGQTYDSGEEQWHQVSADADDDVVVKEGGPESTEEEDDDNYDSADEGDPESTEEEDDDDYDTAGTGDDDETEEEEEESPPSTQEEEEEEEEVSDDDSREEELDAFPHQQAPGDDIDGGEDGPSPIADENDAAGAIVSDAAGDSIAAVEAGTAESDEGGDPAETVGESEGKSEEGSSPVEGTAGEGKDEGSPHVEDTEETVDDTSSAETGDVTEKGEDSSTDADVTSGEEAPTAEQQESVESVNSATDSAVKPASDSEEGKEPAAEGFKKNPRVLSETYLPRGKPIDDATKESLAATWGAWTLADPRADQRPKEDFYAAFPNRDVPRAEFPENAWQTDKDYLSQFLPQASALVKRAMEAILTEYGHGETDESDLSFEERSQMFRLVFTDEFKENEFGGTINQKGFDGLVRRVLHSIMTEDAFVFVMGGHSAAAGHGNHFQQSYTLQFQRVMEPIFARLGVQCTARNIGMGGLGTSQNAIAAGPLYGSVDFLMWDSGMTEREDHIVDMFMRQGLIGGEKVPVLWGGHADILTRLRQYADADVGMPGSGKSGIPKTVDLVQALDLPWAARYLDCEKDLAGECRDRAYNGTCWIDRPDYEPKTKQRSEPEGRQKWHPGSRAHQLRGRVLAFNVLQALEKGLSLWSEAENYEISDDVWHVTSYYENIRTKAMSSVPKQESKDCYDMSLPDRICTVPINGRTEFTPRANPAETSIRSILKHRSHVHRPFKNVYDPPDVRNPLLDVPDGEFDLLGIVENGNAFLPLRARMQQTTTSQARGTLEEDDSENDELQEEEKADDVPAELVPGEGWGLDTKSAPDNCDGSYDSFCGRSWDSDCLLYGHNDYRGGLVFDSLSGWLVMNLDEVKHGVIVVKIEDWHQSGENKKTEGWTCENDADDCTRRARQLVVEEGKQQHLRGRNSSSSSSSLERHLKPAVPEYCGDFQFEFAINGKVTTWNKKEWLNRMVLLQRVVQVWTLLDDESFAAAKNVELAVRARGCARTKTFYLTHVYWA